MLFQNAPKLIQKILLEHWGFSTFRKPQAEIICSALEGNDTIALLPTGGGKSICYQVPGLVFNNITLVVSPLLALMKDQVENLTKKNIRAIAVNSELTHSQIDALFDNLIYGSTQRAFLYVAPERLQNELFLARIQKLKVDLIAVDEAHCVSQWGHDFRPSYLNIQTFREQCFKSTPIMALTASATKEVLADLSAQLGLKKPKIFRKSYYRENIAYNTIATYNKIGVLSKILNRHKNQSGIIYSDTRKKTVEVANYLKALGFTAEYYNGGMESAQRSQNQQKWINNEVQIMSATNAFGMGIDKPDVRFVIHLMPPDSIENYFQEAGRAGRDGEYAASYLLYNEKDIEQMQNSQAIHYPEKATLELFYNQLMNYFQLGAGALNEPITKELFLNEFREKYNYTNAQIYSYLKHLEKDELVTFKALETIYDVVEFKLDTLEILKLRKKSELFDSFMGYLFKVKSNQPKKARFLVNEFLKEKKIERSQFTKMVSYLTDKQWATFIFSSGVIQVTLRNQIYKSSLPLRKYNQLKNNYEQKLAAVFQFLGGPKCRSVVLLNYFGEDHSTPCGICNYCLKQSKALGNSVEKSIQHYFQKHNSLSILRVQESFPKYNLNEVISELNSWVDEEKLKFDGKQFFTEPQS